VEDVAAVRLDLKIIGVQGSGVSAGLEKRVEVLSAAEAHKDAVGP
jgi:hypothetical protein